MAKRKVGEIFSLNVNVPLWILIGTAIIVTIAAYFIIPNNRNDIKFIATLVGGSAAIYSANYGGMALRQQKEREKQKASFEILSMLNRPEFVEVRNFLKKENKDHETISAATLYEKVTTSKEIENAVGIVLGILEDASIAIQTEYECENILH